MVKARQLVSTNDYYSFQKIIPITIANAFINIDTPVMVSNSTTTMCLYNYFNLLLKLNSESNS